MPVVLMVAVVVANSQVILLLVSVCQASEVDTAVAAFIRLFFMLFVFCHLMY